MPNLQQLTIPCTPNADFFEIEDLKIELLTIQADFDHQNFIKNLATSTNLKGFLIKK